MATGLAMEGECVKMRTKRSLLKKVGIALLVLAVAIAAGYIYQVHFNYRFAAITDGKVYKSAAIPPEKLASYVDRYHLKTVVDLRDVDEQPAVDAERAALEKLGVRHVHLPTGQVPPQETVDKFLALMADPGVYPVLIHCHHGVSRSVLFAALYRIEFEGWDNERARLATRLITDGSSFDTDKRKGRYLENYVPQNQPAVNGG
jgi:protein tyrosine phosphatase (PTP) superfamily phosphohydrolase (DUF442 family)